MACREKAAVVTRLIRSQCNECAEEKGGRCLVEHGSTTFDFNYVGRRGDAVMLATLQETSNAPDLLRDRLLCNHAREPAALLFTIHAGQLIFDHEVAVRSLSGVKPEGKTVVRPNSSSLGARPSRRGSK